MFIDGEIVTDEHTDNETSAAGFRNALNSLDDVKTINLHINSPGGSVFEGIAIYNMLKQSKAKVNIYIDALAASIASVIAMSGDTIFMPSNSMMMIHNPYNMVVGNANELRKAADDMDRITDLSAKTYLEKAGDKLDESTLRQLMDEETWLTAQDAVSYGLADVIIGASQAVASLDNPFAKGFKHVPKQLITNIEQEAKTENQKNVSRLEQLKQEFLRSEEDSNLDEQLFLLKEKLTNVK